MPFIVALAIYLFPTIIAIMRGHQNVMPIIAVNVLTGLTIAGWFFSFFWSLTSNVKRIKCAH